MNVLWHQTIWQSLESGRRSRASKFKAGWRILTSVSSPLSSPGHLMFQNIYQVEILIFSGGNVLLAAVLVGLIYKTRNLIPKVQTKSDMISWKSFTCTDWIKLFSTDIPYIVQTNYSFTNIIMDSAQQYILVNPHFKNYRSTTNVSASLVCF